ncbi:hypothetical protein REPUB_Repub15cG0065000 [Reevesia pubescens]
MGLDSNAILTNDDKDNNGGEVEKYASLETEIPARQEMTRTEPFIDDLPRWNNEKVGTWLEVTRRNVVTIKEFVHAKTTVDIGNDQSIDDAADFEQPVSRQFETDVDRMTLVVDRTEEKLLEYCENGVDLQQSGSEVGVLNGLGLFEKEDLDRAGSEE